MPWERKYHGSVQICDDKVCTIILNFYVLANSNQFLDPVSVQIVIVSVFTKNVPQTTQMLLQK